MSPLIAEQDDVEAPVGAATPAMQFDERSRLLIHLLDSAFGKKGWEINRDPRFQEKMGTSSAIIDVVLPVDEHEAAVEKAMEIELRMLSEFRTAISILIVAPAESDLA